MTASRVVNRSAYVSEAATSAVEKAVQELGYVLNSTAQLLAGGGTRTIALVHSDSMTSAYLGELLLGALAEAAARHIHLTVEQYVQGRPSAWLVNQIVDGRAAGVILPPPLCDWQELVEGLLAENIAVVAITPDRYTDGVTAVSVDDRQASYEITKHLVDMGHRRIGFIQGNLQHRGSSRRLEGFLQGLSENGIHPGEELIVPGDFSYRSGLLAAERLLSLPTVPTAILACNDDMAAAAVTIAHQRKIDVPGELSICGFDDAPLASSIWPALTTIRLPVREMSTKAIRALCQELEQGGKASESNSRHVSLQLDYRLIRRQSDARPPKR
ncbi:LacI family transcriptional regulator [Novosphingobium sp. PhB165]|nr:LacI family transcriptional regulator [Novosphingobium sp. PhB165]